uniref:Uncharacterized protein n=1 Tax=Anguilla anguilla TaxID=7936 RepID=A0A0E9S090_ANGAN
MVFTPRGRVLFLSLVIYRVILEIPLPDTPEPRPGNRPTVLHRFLLIPKNCCPGYMLLR